MGLTAAKRWAQVRAAGGEPPAALPYSGPINTPQASAEAGSNRGVTLSDNGQPKARRARKPKVNRDED